MAYAPTSVLAGLQVKVEVYDDKDSLVKTQTTALTSSIELPNAKLWWPFTMADSYGYQYNFKFSLINNNEAIDVYNVKVGIRTVRVTSTQFLINGKPFYFRGFGKHEDLNVSHRFEYFIAAKI